MPELAQPDRDHRRLARRPGPRVRPQVQPPDGGHRPQAEGRHDRGRPAEEGRHPRRPRRRLLPAQRRGSSRAPSTTSTWSRPTASTCSDLVTPYAQNYGVLTFTSDHGLYDAHRRLRQRRLRHLPGLRPRGPLQALRDRDPQRQLARQRARLLGHRGQRHVDAQLEVPRQQRRHLRRLVRLRPPGHAAGLLEVERQPGLLEQPELLHERPRHVLQEHAVREARPKHRVPAVPGPGRLRLHPLRRQLEPDPGQPRSTTTGARGSGCSGCRRRSAATTTPRTSSTPRTATSSSATSWAFSATGKRAPNGVDFYWDEEGKGNCWLGNQAPGGKVTSDPASLPGCPDNGLLHAVQRGEERRRGAVRDVGSEDQPGSARLHLVHDAAEALARNEGVAGTRRPAPRRGGRRCCCSATATAGRPRPPPAPRGCSGRRSRA